MKRISSHTYSAPTGMRLVESVVAPVVILLMLVAWSSAQTVAVVHNFDSSNASQFPSGTPAQGRDGNLYGTAYGETSGAIFSLTTNGAFAQLFALDGADGANPNSGVALASNGIFYGATPFGGSANLGVLFKVASGTYTVLHEFSGGADGGDPTAPPVEASDGNFYGTTFGQPGDSTVYKLTKSGTYSVIATFAGTEGSAIFGTLEQSSDGNLYGTAEEGGAYGYGTVFKMTTTGTVLSHYSFTGGEDGAFPSGGLIQGTDGNFYGVAGGGGKYSFGTIFKFTPKSGFSLLHSFRGGPGDGAYPAFALVQGTDGNLYGTSVSGGANGYGTLFRISPSGAYNLLYSFEALTGELPATGLLQHTSGTFYGTAAQGGANGYGTLFSLDTGLGPFITFVSPTGRVGSPAQILGQGLTGATSVTFNGVQSTTFSVVRDTYMTAVVPTGATTGPVVVTTPTGTLTSNKNFVVLR